MLKSRPTYTKSVERPVAYSPIPTPTATNKDQQVLLNNLTIQINQRLLDIHKRLDQLEGLTEVVEVRDTSSNLLHTLTFERGVLQEES